MDGSAGKDRRKASVDWSDILYPSDPAIVCPSQVQRGASLVLRFNLGQVGYCQTGFGQCSSIGLALRQLVLR